MTSTVFAVSRYWIVEVLAITPNWDGRMLLRCVIISWVTPSAR